jgi:hypothetical protein
MSEKYSSECVKFYTSWFCDVKLQLDIFVDLIPLEIFFNFLWKKIIFEKISSFFKIITFDIYNFLVKI